MERFIVAIETVKIKEFLFSTNKLKVIRGASYLLDYLNQVEVPKILDKNGITKEDIMLEMLNFLQTQKRKLSKL